MKKTYLKIMSITWQEMMVYRLNFVLWRLRWVLQRLVVYFLWVALFTTRQTFFSYTQSMILTYVLLTSIIATFTTGTRTMDVGNIIRLGDLSNLLIRPLNFFSLYIARDTADKFLNLLFGVVEITSLILLLKPEIYLQTNFGILFATLFAVLLGSIIFFYFSLMIGFLAFWLPDVWAPRFLSFVIMEFFTGGLFPLDILPKPLFLLSQLLPFQYFIYFPTKLYLGQMSQMQLTTGFAVGMVWAIGLGYLAQRVWLRGLKVYTSEGR